MQLPSVLQQALEELTEQTSITALREAYFQLSSSYHRGDNSLENFHSPLHILAYLLARMPATYAAIYKALNSVKERIPDWSCKNLLDFGAGPGTASWAATELFPEIADITLFEQSREMLSIGKKLASYSNQMCLQNSQWIQQDLKTLPTIPRTDLAIFSYVHNEVDCLPLIIKAYQLGATVVIIEPGTPKGFANILEIRNALLKLGASIIAPCPHHVACPIIGWCHFPARVERTKVHKLLKEGSLGYEDEKYSYLALSSSTPSPVLGRVVDKPLKLSGHVKLTLCTKEGTLEQQTITKKQKDRYRQARDAEWSSVIKL